MMERCFVGHKSCLRQLTMARLLVAAVATLLFQGGWLLGTCHAQNSTAVKNSTTTQWTGCVSPNDPTEVVSIGSPTTICFVAGNGVNWAAGVTYLRFSFRPNADEYSRFHIPGCEWNCLLLVKS